MKLDDDERRVRMLATAAAAALAVCFAISKPARAEGGADGPATAPVPCAPLAASERSSSSSRTQPS